MTHDLVLAIVVYISGCMSMAFAYGVSERLRRTVDDSFVWGSLVVFWPLVALVAPFIVVYHLGRAASSLPRSLRMWRADRAEIHRLRTYQAKRAAEDARDLQKSEYR